MSKLSNEQSGQPLATTQSNTVINSQTEAELDQLTVNVFFDGTGNNKFNTQTGSSGASEASFFVPSALAGGIVSYENYYSNVALLQMAALEVPEKIVNIYIEGSGTKQGERDYDIKGMGLSRGETGAYDRVAEAFNLMQEACNAVKKERLFVNVFGFSRGSFFARFFCAMLKTKAHRSMGVGIESYYGRASSCQRGNLKVSADQITINFVGIFDTVSSHGVRHYNDVEPFQLNIGAKQKIRKIVHLTAQNEYREHFPLTRVNTAAAEGIAFECSLPGAHSDLGGAYTIDYHEENYISLLNNNPDSRIGTTIMPTPGEIHWEWFKEMGYYKGTPSVNKSEDWGDFVVKSGTAYPSLVYRKVYVNKKFKSNCYQFISLEIMRDIAIREAHISFTGDGRFTLRDNIASIVQEGGVLKKFRDYAHPFVTSASKNNGLDYVVKLEQGLTTQEERQALYHSYIHNSLNPGTTANGSNSANMNLQTGQPHRIIIDDNA